MIARSIVPDVSRPVMGKKVRAKKLTDLRVQIMAAKAHNYFYPMEGRRIAEALRNLGCDVVVSSLDTYSRDQFDWCIAANLLEVAADYSEAGHGTGDDARRHFEYILKHSRRSAQFLLECVQSEWWTRPYQLYQWWHLDWYLDLGFHSQIDTLPLLDHRRSYYFLFSGLTQSERQHLASYLDQDMRDRPIPWVFVGHGQPQRLEIVRELVAEYDHRGFIYMPNIAVSVRDGGPHITEQKLMQVMGKAQSSVWCSHHSYFYMESQRFRQAIMAGAVPIKIMLRPPSKEQADLPFPYLQLDRSTYIQQIREMDLTAMRRRMIEEFCDLPSLEQSLFDMLHQLS